jgi:hypothetical protein
MSNSVLVVFFFSHCTNQSNCLGHHFLKFIVAVATFFIQHVVRVLEQPAQEAAEEPANDKEESFAAAGGAAIVVSVVDRHFIIVRVVVVVIGIKLTTIH